MGCQRDPIPHLGGYDGYQVSCVALGMRDLGSYGMIVY